MEVKKGDILYSNKIYSHPKTPFECQVLDATDEVIVFSAKEKDGTVILDSIPAKKAAEFFKKTPEV